MSSQAEGLLETVRGRYGSVHAFCRKHNELCRSTIYLVLAGRYPGNAERQAERIKLAMARDDKNVLAIRDRLLAAACANCRIKKQKRRKRCPICLDVCMAQAKILIEDKNGLLDC